MTSSGTATVRGKINKFHLNVVENIIGRLADFEVTRNLENNKLDKVCADLKRP